MQSKEEGSTTEPLILPFVLTEFNNIIFEAVLNGQDTLSLKFDSGANGLFLTHEAIRDKTQLLHDGTEYTPTQNYVTLKRTASMTLSSPRWDSLEVYPVQYSGQGSDGRFGWDLFKDKVVVIDYKKQEMLIQEQLPAVIGYDSADIFELNGVIYAEGSVAAKGKKIKGRFMFDTGYQKALLLDSATANKFLVPQDLILIKENQLRNGAGDIFITQVVELPQLEFAGVHMQNIPTQLLNTLNPTQMEVHILGNELLKRFNAVFDFRAMKVYLKKNSLYELPYSDQG